MAFQCPNCSRKLGDSVNPADPPLFCMYCGHRLRGQSVVQEASPHGSVSDSQTRAYEPKPEATVSYGPDTTPASEATPSMVGGYQLVRMLGAGGMGQVYEAMHPGSGQRVAIKLLARRLAANSDSAERFRQEGRVASQISHPNCVFVLRADTEAGRPFIMMELMPGRTLKDLIDDEGPLEVPDAINRIIDVINGLNEAHDLGVIHRDVKPSNCFLTADDRVKVGDFGLAKSLMASEQGQQHLTHSGAFLGTVLFASPEQIRGEPVSYDSDVYAVCATLYYLLMGRAPFQHESLTASLAKAVSEPPPPLRPKRPDVPVQLERTIMKGLDRDRQKRWSTLSELRHALEDIRPERQQPARPRVLSLAYLMDMVILLLITIPVEVLRAIWIGYNPDNMTMLMLSWPSVLVTQLYFTLFEGLLGWTPGKRLLRLRVSKLGQTGPPGLKSAFVRALVFNGLWCLVAIVPELLSEEWPRGVVGWMLAILAMLAGLLGLLVQFRRTPQGWRGLHDRFTDCRVTARPLSNPPSSLESLYDPNIWDRVQPSAVALPTEVGGFAVRHKLKDLPEGGQIWLAEDPTLSRRVLLHLQSDATDPIRDDSPQVRPHRLRVIGHGRILWNEKAHGWVAYVAPTGAPLSDCVSAEQTLSWSTTRALLEQLVHELEFAEEQGLLPPTLNIDQVWIEPSGRLQLLEFPLKGTSPNVDWPIGDQPLSLLRATATLALEGSARTSREPIAAPIPPHAMQMLNRQLMNDKTPLSQFRQALNEDHQQPATVSVGMRAAHLTLQTALLAVGLLVIYLISGGFSFAVALLETRKLAQPQLLLTVLDSPAETERLRQRVDREYTREDSLRAIMLAALTEDHRLATKQRIQVYADRQEQVTEYHLRTVILPERKLIERINRLSFDFDSVTAEDVNFFTLLIDEEGPNRPGGRRSRERDRVGIAPQPVRAEGDYLAEPFPGYSEYMKIRWFAFVGMLVACLMWPVIWIGCAFVFRGGIAFQLAGLTLVRRNGKPLGRFLCAIREFLVWLPIVTALMLSLWLQAHYPLMSLSRTMLWLIGAVLLALYLIIAIRQPSRPPQDQLLGSRIVPK